MNTHYKTFVSERVNGSGVHMHVCIWPVQLSPRILIH